MEELDKQFHISFIGNNDNSSTGFVSLNFAYDMLSRNYSVVYTTSAEETEINKFFKIDKQGNEKNSIIINKTKIEKFSIVSISDDFDSRYSDKIDNVFSSIDEQPDIFIHNIKNPLTSPYNTILPESDLWVLVMKIESTAASDYFNIIKKLMILEKHPPEIHVVFSNTKDMERAFEIYQKILKDSGEFMTGILPVFTGIVQSDLLRQAHSIRQGIPLRMLFSECSVSGAISFMGDKIIRRLVRE